MSQPHENFPQAPRGAKETLDFVWPYIWPKGRMDLKFQVVFALVAMVLGKIVTVLIPYTYKWATNAFGAAHPANLSFWELIILSPIIMVVAYNGARFLSQALNNLRDALFAAVGQHAVRGLSNRAFQHLHNLSLRFHLKRRTGGLSRVIERGKNGIETIVRLAMMFGVPTVIEFVLTAVILTNQFSWVYVVIITAMTILYVWFSIWASNQRIQIRKDMNEADTDAMSKAVDSLLNYETVKYFSNEELEINRYNKSTEMYEKAAIKTYTSLAWLNFGQALIFSSAMLIVMLMSANEVVSGKQTLGHFVMINAFMMQLAMPLNFIGTLYREITVGLIDMGAMFSLLDEPKEVEDAPNAHDLEIKNGAVSFENVEFAYDPDRPILKGVSFEVPAGKTVAIVGPSGAGKSTISRLLFRFYDVKAGSVKIDGQDLREITQKSLRKYVGMVPQDTVLFNDTIAYNIGYGKVGSTREEVIEAADRAQISDFIASQPKGFDSEVGERGLKLSGGEKQRVAIARTLLKAPPILILDEATSALDTHTEREIQAALDEVSKNRTTLVIAHRLSTIVDADEIIVLKDGVIAERGTHENLIEQDGLYKSMWDRQKDGSDDEELKVEAE